MDHAESREDIPRLGEDIRGMRLQRCIFPEQVQGHLDGGWKPMDTHDQPILRGHGTTAA